MKRIIQYLPLIFLFSIACSTPEKLLPEDYKAETEQYKIFIGHGERIDQSMETRSEQIRKYENTLLSDVIEDIYPENADLSLIQLPFTARFPVKVEVELKHEESLDIDSLLRAHLQEAWQYQVKEKKEEVPAYELSSIQGGITSKELEKDNIKTTNKMVIASRKEFSCENCDQKSVLAVLSKAFDKPVVLASNYALEGYYSFEIVANTKASYIGQLKRQGVHLKPAKIDRMQYQFVLKPGDRVKALWETISKEEK